MNKTDKKHLLSHLAQVKGTEHLAQITTEMSKRMWTMKKTHSMEEDIPIWKLFPGTAALWEARLDGRIQQRHKHLLEMPMSQNSGMQRQFMPNAYMP